MSRQIENDDGDELSGGEEDDDEFEEDMKALRRVCIITGTSLNDLENNSKCNEIASPSVAGAGADFSGATGNSDSEDDRELLRNIRNRFSISTEVFEPLSLKPLCAVLPSDDEDDDFEILCAVRRRFAAYHNGDTLRKSVENLTKKSEQIHASSKSNDSLVDETGACEVLPNPEEAANATSLLSNDRDIQPSDSTEERGSDGFDLSTPILNYSSFPKSGQVFINAIKRNRSCQKFLRHKLMQIEARIEENKKLRERVKLLKDFQVNCRKITGRALSQGNDPRIRLIAAHRTSNLKDSKVDDKKIPAIQNGPLENSSVANYRMALTNFPISFTRKIWSEAEKENLGKGIRQQFQEMMLQFSVDQFSDSEGSPGNANNLDSILSSIRDLEITPEMIREFLPKVNWDRLASLHVKGHSGAECEARWLNYEDPLINWSPWTNKEDKNLLFVVQEKGITNWFDIAVLLGTNRTPFQCLARFQRSLNAYILKREWSRDEDIQLRAAVETFGEHNWQAVASTLVGRTGPQCSNRWMKSLRPNRKGRWNLDENIRLDVAVKLFGPKNWMKIAQFVPGRTQSQCRDRWVNCLDSSLHFGVWTEEEDLRLKEATEEYGYCWSKVAKCLPGRTDNQCWRRWKVLFPREVPLLQAARQMKKAALVSNFVDREAERPALGPSDFIPSLIVGSVSETENTNQSRKPKRKSRGPESGKENEKMPLMLTNGEDVNKRKKKKPKSKGKEPIKTNDNDQSVPLPPESLESGITFGDNFWTSGGSSSPSSEKQGARKQHSEGKKPPKPNADGMQPIETDDNNSLLKLPLETLESGITNGDGFQTLGGNSNSSGENEKDNPQHPRCDTGTTLGEREREMLSGTTNDDVAFIHDHVESNLLAATNREERGMLGLGQPDAATKKRVTKLRSRRKTLEDPDGSNLVSSRESSKLGVTNMENVENPSNEEGKTTRQYFRRKKSTKPSGGGQHVPSVPCQQNTHINSKPKDKSCSGQVIGAEDEYDVTLVCLRNKAKKKMVVIGKNFDPAARHPSTEMRSESLSKGVDQLNGGSKMPYLTQNGEVQTRYNNGTSENILSCKLNSNHLEPAQATVAKGLEPCVDMVNHGTVFPQEPVSIKQQGDVETGDLTIANLLCNQRKKRRPSLTQWGNGTRPPSHAKK